jgi:hypothetical protein
MVIIIIIVLRYHYVLALLAATVLNMLYYYIISMFVWLSRQQDMYIFRFVVSFICKYFL